MKKLCLLISLLICFSFAGCKDENRALQSNGDNPSEEIIIPPFNSEIGEKVSFDSITYTRPDTDKLINGFVTLGERMTEEDIGYDELVSEIDALDEEYSVFDTMCAYLMIKTSEEVSDTDLADEYKLLTSKAPAVQRAIEDLFVILANSVYADRLEEEVFGENFLEEYKDGTKYNDYVVSLLERESELEAEYYSLSGASVEIIFEGITDTYDNTVNRIKDLYSSNKIKYNKALEVCDTLLQNEIKRQSGIIYVKLLKTRSKLAEAYGMDSYAEYAYENLGHDYSEEAMAALIKDVADYAVPVYSALSQKAFAGYFKTHRAPVTDTGKTVNDLFGILSEIDTEIADVYSYMLNCGLFSFGAASDTRREGAFTLYLQELDAPFIFASFNNTPGDYMTLSHEFGHFYDEFKNGAATSSLDLAEVASQSLELITLCKSKDELDTDTYKYLYYEQIKTLLETLIFQAFYAKFESLAYELPYEEINEKNLDALVVRAATEMKLNTEYLNSLSEVVIVHLIDTPFYVQSYCTSLVASLDVFFAEREKAGDGINKYKALINREEQDDGFIKSLEQANISSPFKKGAIIDYMDKIYFSIIGSHYYDKEQNQNNAA